MSKDADLFLSELIGRDPTTAAHLNRAIEGPPCAECAIPGPPCAERAIPDSLY